VIGSGPTVPDPTTLAEAYAIVERRRLALPPAALRALADPANESPKPGDPVFARTEYHLVARPADAFRAVEAKVVAAGFEPLFLGDRMEGEARDVAATHAGLARAFQAGRRGRAPPALMISALSSLTARDAFRQLQRPGMTHRATRTNRRDAAQRVCALAALAAAFTIAPLRQAAADFRVCNNTSSRVGIA